MINKLIKIFLCFTISISFAQDNANSSNIKSKYVNVQIEGMHCAGGCAKYIENQLNNTEGLVAMVNFANSQALIAYDTQLFSDGDVVDIINTYQGGKFKASLLDAKKSTCSKVFSSKTIEKSSTKEKGSKIYIKNFKPNYKKLYTRSRCEKS